METLAASLATLALVLARTVYEVVRDRRARECTPGATDCYLPDDRRRDRATYENVVKMCIKNGIDPEV